MNTPLIGSRRSIWRGAVSVARGKIGTILERLGAAARIKEFEYVDPSTDAIVYLSTGARYSVLHVGAKMFFFDRVTGQFDGTGELLQERVADGFELLN